RSRRPPARTGGTAAATRSAAPPRAGPAAPPETSHPEHYRPTGVMRPIRRSGPLVAAAGAPGTGLFPGRVNPRPRLIASGIPIRRVRLEILAKNGTPGRKAR